MCYNAISVLWDISYCTLSSWIAKQRDSPACTASIEALTPSNKTWLPLGKPWHYQIHTRSRLFVPEQDSVQTLKSYGITIYTRHD